MLCLLRPATSSVLVIPYCFGPASLDYVCCWVSAVVQIVFFAGVQILKLAGQHRPAAILKASGFKTAYDMFVDVARAKEVTVRWQAAPCLYPLGFVLGWGFLLPVYCRKGVFVVLLCRISGGHPNCLGWC